MKLHVFFSFSIKTTCYCFDLNNKWMYKWLKHIKKYIWSDKWITKKKKIKTFDSLKLLRYIIILNLNFVHVFYHGNCFYILGLSVIYLLGLLFILFQSYDTIKSIMYWFYPDLIDFRIDTEKVKCISFWFFSGLVIIKNKNKIISV